MRILLRWTIVSFLVLVTTVIAVLAAVLVYARKTYGMVGPGGSYGPNNPRGMSPSEWADDYWRIALSAGMIGLITLSVAVLYWAGGLAWVRGLREQTNALRAMMASLISTPLVAALVYAAVRLI